jgi:exopolyphosphatase/guanosine-5'-triphosphate,3'-diphosphate pyrophosphatase
LSVGKTKHSFLVQVENAHVHGQIRGISIVNFQEMHTQKAAVIDLGTNTFKWLAAQYSPDGFETLYTESQKVNLGEGISQGLLTDAAMQRGLATLIYACENLSKNDISIANTRVVGTSAVRNAKNHMEWVEKVNHATGLYVEVIDGDEEANLIFKGIVASGSLKNENVLIMDIGGGSVEFIIGHVGGILWKKSFEIGGSRLREQFHSADPIDVTNIELLYAYFGSQLTSLVEAIYIHKPIQLVGSSGSFDTLAWMCHLASRIPHEKFSMKKYEVSLDYFEQVYHQFLKLNRAKRLALPGMIELRVDLIVVGSILIKWVLQHLHERPILVSGYSLKEGVISDMLAKP